MTLEAAFRVALEAIGARAPLDPLGLAVSGGGDSTALLLLAAGWAEERGVTLRVASVDHGLRPEAAAEAARVARRCAEIAVPHTVLRWDTWDGRGNLQDAARRARRRLLADWAKARGIGTVLTGHTRDDQAETVLLRLARGSGVDGLAGIAPVSEADGVTWGRPLLDLDRAALRDWLQERGEAWAEDPSNADPRFDRVRARGMLAALGDLGLTVDRLVATAARMRTAAEALEEMTADLAVRAVAVDRGDLVIDRAAFLEAPADIRARLLSAALCWVSGQVYRPRYAALQALLAEVARGRGGTLHGARVRAGAGGRLRVLREAKAVAEIEARPGTTFDGRWCVEGPFRPGDRIAALGGAVADLPEWRDSGLPRDSLMASPAVWRGGDLVAAPLAGFGREFTARLVQGRDVFSARSTAH